MPFQVIKFRENDGRSPHAYDSTDPVLEYAPNPNNSKIKIFKKNAPNFE